MTRLWHHQEDYRLYLEYIQGSIEAGTILYEKSYGLVYGYAHKFTRGSTLNFQDVEDIISQTIDTAFSKKNSFSGKSLFSTWMCGIVRYKALKMYHRKKILRDNECEWCDDVPDSCNPLDIIIKKELSQAIICAYESLSYNLKECIFLIDLLGKTHKEAARELLISNSDFQARYSRATRTMHLHFMRIYHGANIACY